MSKSIADERGSVAEGVIIAPVLLGLLMLIVQWTLYAHAEALAEAAAQEGAEAGRRADGTLADADAAAAGILDTSGGVFSTVAAVSGGGGTEVTVTVTGTVTSVFPGINPRVRETSSGPKERYVAPVENP